MDHHPSADDGSAIGATVAVADLLFDAYDAQRSLLPCRVADNQIREYASSHVARAIV